MGKAVPAAFLDRPEIEAEHLLFWDAFWEIGTDRQLGSSIGPLPYSSLRRYAADHGIAGDLLDLFRGVLRMVDGHFIKLNSPAPPGEEGLRDLIDPTDIKSIRALLRRNAPPPKPPPTPVEVKIENGEPD